MANEQAPVTAVDGHTIKVTEPTQLQIVTPHGEPLLTIHRDGRWEFRDESAPTEAAKVFVRAVQRIVAGQRDLTEAALREIAADLYRNHDMPPQKDSRSYSYRNGWWDGVHHAAKVVERAARSLTSSPETTAGGA